MTNNNGDDNDSRSKDKRNGRNIAGLRLLRDITGVRCGFCNQYIWSRHRHDFRHCTCGKTFVDGGRDYLRYGAEADSEGNYTPPKVERYNILIDPVTGDETLISPDTPLT